MSTSLFSKTPDVTVLDNRALTVRAIAYHRHPDTPDVEDVRITRHRHNARGVLAQSADPRLHAAALANFTWSADLCGAALRTASADAGITVALNDAAGRPLLAVSNINTTADVVDNSQAVTRTWQYEDASLPGRPLSITEQTPDGVPRVTERFVYASNGDTEKAHNLAGQCVSHYDTAGRMQTDSVALTTVPLSVTRQLLKDADNPATVADWQGADACAWNDQLNDAAYVTLSTADATGAVLSTIDAKGNAQRMAYDAAGLLSATWLTLKGDGEQIIVKSLTYSAAGQKLREEHGNGVVTTYTYEPQTQRLCGIETKRPDGHACGAKVLQDLRYEYDPVGNVLKISNDAEATRFWRNQKVVPENVYAYDSLYQLVSATGREMASAGQQGSSLPCAMVPLPTDSCAYTCYERTYSYDNAGNLKQIRHSAPATNHSYTTDITVSNRSNRAVLSSLTKNPEEVDALFTAGGQQTLLLPGQRLIWTPRNELLKVTPVVHDGAADDRESYRYDGGSQRVLKVSQQKTGSTLHTQRVLYLPGLELRTTTIASNETERLQVVTVGEAGRAQVRVLHWENGKPDAISNDQVRWSYDNLTGSIGLEVDKDGNIISMEEYYPYGGTAILTARSAVEVAYKTIKYTGKEQDATGLYYYGYRYYLPWVGRWLSSDPASTADGLNLFRFCKNSPSSQTDKTGLSSLRLNENQYLGLGKEAEIYFSEEIRNTIIERFKTDKKLALRNLSELSGHPLDSQELGETYVKIYNTLAAGELIFNFQAFNPPKLNSKRLLNIWHTNLKPTEGYLYLRDDTEMSIFMAGGAGFEDFSNKINIENKGFEYGRPVYGSLSIGGTPSAGAMVYGPGIMTLNSDLKDYITYTPKDSLVLYEARQYSIRRPGITHTVGSQDNLNPIIAGLNLAQYNDLMAGRSPTEYIEWQSHTPVLFKDVNEVSTSSPDYKTQSKIKKFSKKIDTTFRSK